MEATEFEDICECLLHRVHSWLKPRTLAIAATVSRRWHQAASSPEVWQRRTTPALLALCRQQQALMEADEMPALVGVAADERPEGPSRRPSGTPPAAVDRRSTSQMSDVKFGCGQAMLATRMLTAVHMMNMLLNPSFLERMNWRGQGSSFGRKKVWVSK